MLCDLFALCFPTAAAEKRRRESHAHIEWTCFFVTIYYLSYTTVKENINNFKIHIRDFADNFSAGRKSDCGVENDDNDDFDGS